ncbi:sugar phosphate isomerase/epimerase family protein [Methanocaldococcus infernus]
MRFGISSLVFLPESLDSALNKITNKFGVWEVVCEGNHYLDVKNIKLLRDAKEKYKVDIVVHAPFADLNPASMNYRVRELTINCIRDAIEGAYELDAELVVIHPGYIPELWKDLKEEVLDNNFSTILKLVEIAEDYGVKLGLENMPNFPGVLCQKAEELKNILNEIDSKYLGVTLDIGHANTVGNIEEFIDELRNKIIHIHIHDNNGERDEHLAIGEGKINFYRVLKKLVKIGYDKILTIENKNLRDALKSKEILLEILEDL